MAEEVKSSRFKRPSDSIDLEKLEKETQKLLFLGLLVAVSMHAAVGSFYMFKTTVVKVVKPPTMELVIRRPRMTKAFEFKKKRVQKRVIERKQIVQRKPTADIQTKTISTMDIMGSVISYEFETEMDTDLGSNLVISEGIEIEMTTTREPEKQISMKEEMITLADLDTGQFKAMVIQDPNNKTEIQGFIYIANAWGAQLNPPNNLKRGIINLSEALNRYTNIKSKVDRHLFLDSSKLFNIPFVYITAGESFELTDIEAANFGNYLRNGGFAVVDNGDPKSDFSQAEAALRQCLVDALGADAKFLPIPNNHPLYHSFFDFDDGPPQGGELTQINAKGGNWGLTDINDFAVDMSPTENVYFLEGIWIDNRLVAIYSDKAYSLKWRDLTNNEPQLKMGVNMVVFALTQQGSIVQQKMDFFSSSK